MPILGRAYPRVCGATARPSMGKTALAGLSPRVRGNPDELHVMLEVFGPIPACAGQPTSAASPTTIPRAYPRVCGATPCALDASRRGKGLSPRVRGNPRCIPADAGR